MLDEVIYTQKTLDRTMSLELVDLANFDLLCWQLKQMRKELPEALEVTITIRGICSE